MYPCNDNELVNFVCIHPEAESQGSKEVWVLQWKQAYPNKSWAKLYRLYRME
jgi:hypothetical protein